MFCLYSTNDKGKISISIFSEKLFIIVCKKDKILLFFMIALLKNSELIDLSIINSLSQTSFTYWYMSLLGVIIKCLYGSSNSS